MYTNFQGKGCNFSFLQNEFFGKDVTRDLLFGSIFRLPEQFQEKIIPCFTEIKILFIKIVYIPSNSDINEKGRRKTEVD